MIRSMQMKLLYIGTGAADWTSRAGARDGVMRRFTCALVDDTLLIDLAPTTPHDLFGGGGALSGVTDILYTHSHDDHYDADTLAALAAGHPLHVWVSSDFAPRIPQIPDVEVHVLTPGTSVKIGKYTVTPLRANHRLSAHPGEQALHYVIDDGTRRIFWGADGSWLPTDTWYALRNMRPYDRIVLDGTLGEARGDHRIFEHNSLPMIRLMAETMRAEGCLAPDGRICLTHFSRDSHEPPHMMEKNLTEEGFYAALDDMEDIF